MDEAMKTYAGFWQRAKAFAFDYMGIVLYLAFIAGLFVFVNSFTDISQRLFANRVLAQTSAFLLVTFPITMYFAIGESSAKQDTWGKRRMGLKVVDRGGNRIGFWRAFARTLLKFIPWELSHTLIWQINFSTGSFPAFINYGFALVYILIGLNIASLVMTKTKQTLYDFLAGTFVVGQQYP
jgi:uncharacterized RDD family membrane protein YckC